MAKYTKRLDIWPLSPEERRKLPIGQYVTAGPGGPLGRFWGERHASTVVAWRDNARGMGFAYHRALREYARAGETPSNG